MYIYIYIHSRKCFQFMITQDTFFGQNSFEDGIKINYRGEAFWSFWQLSILIADEVAIKQSIESKGAAARLFCCRCWNVISKFSWDNAVGTSVGMHGCFSVQAAHQWICAEGRQVLGGTTWEDVQSAVLQTWHPASNWKPSGLLKNPGGMVGSFLSVSGSIGSTSFWCMGLRIVSLRFFLELWCRLGSVVAWKLFWLLLSGPSNFRFRRLTRSLAREIAALSPWNAQLLRCDVECIPDHQGFHCAVCLGTASTSAASLQDCSEILRNLDHLSALNRGGTCAPIDLHAVIKDYLDSFVAVNGDEFWVPKCHMALYLG